MTQTSNLHTHSVFSDGHNTPRELIEEALSKGFRSIGFSDHSYTPVQGNCSMLPGDELRQYEEVRRLADEYCDRIRVYEGIELDYHSVKPALDYDYVIGSVHELTKDGETFPVDNGAELEKRLIAEWYGGDTARFAADYFEQCVRHANENRADIVGHFDLVTKYSLIDEEDVRYRNYAIDAAREIVKVCPTFEMNTGAIARKYRTLPYPADFLVEEIKRGHGRFVITTDCHYRERLTDGYEVAKDLLLAHGFQRNPHGALNRVVDDTEIWE